MKITWKLLAIIRAMAMVDGRITEKVESSTSGDENKDCWISMIWLHDYFTAKNGFYYIGYDQSHESYIIEWHGKDSATGTNDIIEERILSINRVGYTNDIAEAILKAIKAHKKYLEEIG